MRGWPKGKRRVNPEFCRVENCGEKVISKGLCVRHYARYKRMGDTNIKPKQSPVCIVAGCGKLSYARNWCVCHYAKWLKYGTTDGSPRKIWPSICIIENCGQKSHLKGLCSFHYHRRKNNISFDRPKGNKGCLNHNWAGGKFPYKEQRIMKKNRLIKFAQVNGICEVCHKRKAKKVHHKDFSKTNHAIENLLAVCNKCHGIMHKGRICQTSKFIRQYGFALPYLADKLTTTRSRILSLHYKGLLQKAIEEGKPLGLGYHSKYTAMYGIGITQLIRLLHLSYPKIRELHVLGKLKDIIKQGYYQRKSKIADAYGNSTKNLAIILHCKTYHIYKWHKDLTLKQRLAEKNFTFLPKDFSLQTSATILDFNI